MHAGRGRGGRAAPRRRSASRDGDAHDVRGEVEAKYGVDLARCASKRSISATKMPGITMSPRPSIDTGIGVTFTAFGKRILTGALRFLATATSPRCRRPRRRRTRRGRRGGGSRSRTTERDHLDPLDRERAEQVVEVPRLLQRVRDRRARAARTPTSYSVNASKAASLLRRLPVLPVEADLEALRADEAEVGSERDGVRRRARIAK